MTQQIVREHQETDIKGCEKCKCYKATALFELCTNEKAVYSPGLKHQTEFHTCQHMRGLYGLCGSEMRLR